MRLLVALCLVVAGYFGLMLIFPGQHHHDAIAVSDYAVETPLHARFTHLSWDRVPLPSGHQVLQLAKFRSQADQARAGEAQRIHPVTLKQYGERLLRERQHGAR